MKIGFVYGGQGSQVHAMGKDLYLEYSFIKDFYDSLEGDFSIKDMSFHGDIETISKTQYTQPILLAFQIAMTKVLDHHGINPDIVMGLSLGEYGALYGSGVLDEKDAIDIIQFRSKEMTKAAEAIDSKMLAVLSDDIEMIRNLCQEYRTSRNFAQISNINTRGQIVISGESSVVSKVQEVLKEMKYRTIELNTSGPFHTAYMDEVAKNLSDYFTDIDFKNPKIPIIYNYSGDFKKNKDIKTLMSKQVNNTVQFKLSLERLIDEKPDLIIEIGHKNVIKGFMKKLDKDMKLIGVNDLESVNELIREVERYGS